MINKEVEALIAADEKGRSEPPTKADITETIDLLSDFGIHTVIPKDISSRAQLYSWRHEAIMNRLNQ